MYNCSLHGPDTCFFLSCRIQLITSRLINIDNFSHILFFTPFTVFSLLGNIFDITVGIPIFTYTALDFSKYIYGIFHFILRTYIPQCSRYTVTCTCPAIVGKLGNVRIASRLMKNNQDKSRKFLKLRHT